MSHENSSPEICRLCLGKVGYFGTLGKIEYSACRDCGMMFMRDGYDLSTTVALVETAK